MTSVKHLNQPAKLILLTLFLLCLLYLSGYYFKLQQRNGFLEKNEIKAWFNDEALNYNPKNLHYASAWGYLTAEEFKEIILDGISKMNPQINKHEKIFELGVGVGAALKVIENYIGTDQLEIGGSDIAENAIDQAKKIFPKQADHFLYGT